jgi:hypothetical protein
MGKRITRAQSNLRKIGIIVEKETIPPNKTRVIRLGLQSTALTAPTALSQQNQAIGQGSNETPTALTAPTTALDDPFPKNRGSKGQQQGSKKSFTALPNNPKSKDKGSKGSKGSKNHTQSKGTPQAREATI